MLKLQSLFLAVSLFLALPASAEQLKVATGGAKGTYSTMFKEITSVARCTDSVPLLEQNTSGSVENVNLLLGNKVNAAIAQMDVLWLRNQTEDLSKVKTLVALHPEEVHLLALTTSKVIVGKTLGFGGKPYVFSTINDLANARVGAAGGSAVTAQVIRLQSQVNFNVVTMDNNDQVLQALRAGQIEAGLFVGGQPMPLIDGLDGTFKILSMPPDVVERLKAVYKPARLSYMKLGAQGVPTVSIDSLFVTREYKTPAMQSSLAALRKCILEKVPELQETTGTHPKWQGVDPANKGKWPWYELPTTKK